VQTIAPPDRKLEDERRKSSVVPPPDISVYPSLHDSSGLQNGSVPGQNKGNRNVIVWVFEDTLVIAAAVGSGTVALPILIWVILLQGLKLSWVIKGLGGLAVISVLFLVAFGNAQCEIEPGSKLSSWTTAVLTLFFAILVRRILPHFVKKGQFHGRFYFLLGGMLLLYFIVPSFIIAVSCLEPDNFEADLTLIGLVLLNTGTMIDHIHHAVELFEPDLWGVVEWSLVGDNDINNGFKDKLQALEEALDIPKKVKKFLNAVNEANAGSGECHETRQETIVNKWRRDAYFIILMFIAKALLHLSILALTILSLVSSWPAGRKSSAVLGVAILLLVSLGVGIWRAENMQKRYDFLMLTTNKGRKASKVPEVLQIIMDKAKRFWEFLGLLNSVQGIAEELYFGNKTN